jgi:hypothetical protein
MTTNTLKPGFSKTNFLALACLASLAGAATNAQAQNLGQCLKNTASCGVKIAQTQIDLLAAATDVIAFTAANPNCIADIAASNFVTIGVSTSMVSLAAAGVLKQQGGSYKSYIYGQGGRPMVEALGTIVPVPALSNLLKQNDDALIGPAFAAIASSIPVPSAGAPNLDMQLECGSAIAVAGQSMVGKVKSFVGHAKGAVKSCSAAASCFAGVMADIVKDPVGALSSAGDFVLDAADDLKDAVFGGCKNMDSQVYFDANFKPWTNDIAFNVIWGGQANAYNVKAEALVKSCVSYYTGCDSQSKDANRRCTVMSTGAKQDDGNGWIEGKGLEQLVRTRQMELRIPQFLATEMKWALAQPTSGKDTALINQQFARLPTQLQPLIKAKFSFSFKSEREAAVRKIMGFALSYSGNGDFGGKDAKVLMAGQSIGALMLAYVPTQGAENKSTNTKINDLYKQYFPNGDALLQQIEAAVGESMGKAMAEVVKQNGEAWNEAFTNTQLQKMAQRLGDCKDAHKDAAKTCKQNIADAIKFAYSAMPALGKANNYAGIGALGTQNPSHLSYVKFIQDTDNTVGKHVAHSALVIFGESPLAGTGNTPAPTPASAPTSAIATNAQTPPVPPKPAAANIGPIGMPAAPAMGMIAINSPRPAPPLLASTPPPSKTPVVVAAVAPSFDAVAYRKMRVKQIEDEWLPQCAGHAPCLQRMSEITQNLVNREVTALSTGTPLHTDRIAVSAFQNSLDPIFDPQFKAVIPVVATSTPPLGSGGVINKKPDLAPKIK